MDLLIVLGIPLIGVACGIAFLCGLAIGGKCCWLWLLLAGFSTVPVGGIAMLGAFQGAFNSEPVNLYRTDFFGYLAELLERSEHPVQAAKQMEAEVAAGVWERKCKEFLPPQLPDAVLYVGIVCAIVAFSALRMKNSWKRTAIWFPAWLAAVGLISGWLFCDVRHSATRSHIRMSDNGRTQLLEELPAVLEKSSISGAAAAGIVRNYIQEEYPNVCHSEPASMLLAEISTAAGGESPQEKDSSGTSGHDAPASPQE